MLNLDFFTTLRIALSSYMLGSPLLKNPLYPPFNLTSLVSVNIPKKLRHKYLHVLNISRDSN